MLIFSPEGVSDGFVSKRKQRTYKNVDKGRGTSSGRITGMSGDHNLTSRYQNVLLQVGDFFNPSVALLRNNITTTHNSEYYKNC
jgi:hypothetical protein